MEKNVKACQACPESYFFMPLKNQSMVFVLKATSGSASRWQLFFSSFLIFPLRFSLSTETYGLLSWGLTFICKNIFCRHSVTCMGETLSPSCSHCKWQTKETGIEAVSWMISSYLHNKYYRDIEDSFKYLVFSVIIRSGIFVLQRLLHTIFHH